MKNFKKIASVIKQTRLEAGLSQLELAQSIGYKQGQFISNVERAQCSIPENRVKVTAQVLGVKPTLLTEAMLADYAMDLKQAIK